MHSKNSDGFHVIELLIFALIIGVGALVGYNTWSALQKKSATTQQAATSKGGQVCYEKTPRLYCYDILTKKHTEITGAQLPKADTHFIMPSPDASKYLVIAETGSEKHLTFEYYLGDSKLKNMQKLSDMRGLYTRGVAWKSDNSGFYYTGTDTANAGSLPTDALNQPSQIFYYDVAQDKSRSLTKHTTEKAFSNPVLSADGRTLAVLVLDSPGIGPQVETVTTDTAQIRDIGRLPASFFWDQLLYDRTTDAIIAHGSSGDTKQTSSTADRWIVMADLLKGELAGNSVPQGRNGALFDTLAGNYIFHRVDSESFVFTGFDLISRADGASTNVPFKESDSSLLFVLPNEQNPLL